MGIKLGKKIISQLLFTVIFILLLNVIGFAQNNAGLIVSPGEDYLLGPSDIIDVKIEDAPELSGTFRLSARGMFILPIVGQITAENKRTYEVAQAIADKLRGSYLTNPIVNVSLKQGNSHAYFIQGAVRSPGVYQVEGHLSLLKLITIAGGLSDKYGTTAYVMREKKASFGELTSIKDITDNSQQIKQVQTNVAETQPAVNDQTKDAVNEDEDKYEVIKANITNLLRGNFDQNVNVIPGDIIHIPQADIYFVAGEVKAPGSFTLKEGTTLRQAISLAQGTNYEGNAEKGIIFREDQSTGKREEIPINISAVMSGKQSDMDILANDIIIVPNSQKKTIVKGVLKGLAGGIPAIILRSLGF